MPKKFFQTLRSVYFWKNKTGMPQKFDLLGTPNAGASPIAQKVVGPDFLYLEKSSKIEKKIIFKPENSDYAKPSGKAF